MSEFDRYGEGGYERALERSISFGGQEASFYSEVKARRLVDLAWRRVGDPSSLEALDVGAGIGLVDEHLTDDFGRVVGLDVSSAMVERAAERNPGVEYVAYDGTTFPFETASFDVVFASCVFHHVPVGRAGAAGRRDGARHASRRSRDHPRAQSRSTPRHASPSLAASSTRTPC